MPSPSRQAFCAAAVLLTAAALGGCLGGMGEGGVRLGYFPNLTHAQALYGLETGLFEQELGPEFEFRAVAFNAGPQAMEALLSGSVDVAYVGPSPTINSLVVTGPNVVRILAGAASGGARFIVQPDLAAANVSAFAGKTLATPGLGNTQDVSLKHYLLEHGLRSKDRGGSVQVLNAQNADILTLFTQGNIDGAWVPEPWAVRLETDAGGVEYVDEADLWEDGQFVTTHLVTTKTYLDHHPREVAALLRAHVNATAAIQAGDREVLDAINDAIESATGKRLGAALLEASFPRVAFTNDPLPATLVRFADLADDLGYLRGDLPAAHRVYDLGPLNDALATAGQDPVPSP